MLVAYLDEFGHVGPYISTEHRKFFHHPAFGYAGLVLPEDAVRAFGAKFENVKARHFRNEIVQTSKHPRRWEKKGSEIFSTGAIRRRPDRTAMVADLMDYAHRLGGHAFYYGELKPVGTQRQTGQDSADRTRQVLTETIRHLCRYADRRAQNLTVLLDKGGPMPREDAITALATFIYGNHDPQMRRIIEVPMELESHRYGAVQFADWLCAILSRASHYHLTQSDEFNWAPHALWQILDHRVAHESRIWLPATSTRLQLPTLTHHRRWLTSQPHTHQTHLTQTLAQALDTTTVRHLLSDQQ